MAQFRNFKIWRGRLPHWRADDVTYYVTFRHSRALDATERAILFAQLLRPDTRKYDLTVACVLPEKSELVFRVREGRAGPNELSDIVERAKSKAGNLILKKSGERFPPFYSESFDRIIRDEAELEERVLAIIASPEAEELCEDSSTYETLFVVNAP
jgi:hypothetical protein